MFKDFIGMRKEEEANYNPKNLLKLKGIIKLDK